MLDSERSGIRDTAERLLIQNECGAAEAAELARGLEPPYSFVIFSGEGRGVSTLEYVRGTLCGPGKGAVGCLAGSERLYILQSGLGSAESVIERRRVIDMLTRLYLLRCGVSDFFYDLAETSERRAQALLALSFREGGGRVRTFRENYVEIVEHCACDYYGSRASQLKCLDALEDADGELLKTLELYLRSSRRPAAVAEALGLHRNTVINRIRKAEGAAGARPH